MLYDIQLKISDDNESSIGDPKKISSSSAKKSTCVITKTCYFI